MGIYKFGVTPSSIKAEKREREFVAMNWTIVRDANAKSVVERMLIIDDGMTKGEIVKERGDTQYTVNLMMVKELTFRNGSMDRCVGYVRGVEATVNLYAKETGRKRA